MITNKNSVITTAHFAKSQKRILFLGLLLLSNQDKRILSYRRIAVEASLLKDRKGILMADVNRGNRPLSPHLSIYRPQLTSITSILTRITGNALLLGTIMVIWWLLAAATSPAYFELVNGVVTSWFGKLILLGSIWALWYHSFAGLRHLIWDNAIGLDVPTAEKLGWGVIIGSLLLSVITILVL